MNGPRGPLLVAAAAAVAVGALAGCADEQPAQPTGEVTSSPIATDSPTETERVLDPDIPDNAVLQEDDVLGLEACELWTAKLGSDQDLREVAEDVYWRADRSTNEFLSSPISGDGWAEANPSQFRIFCEWNGYSVEEGSPAELLG